MFTPNFRSAKHLSLSISALALLLALAGCQSQAPPAPDTRAADEAAIRAACDDQVKAFAAADVAKMVSFYTEDAVAMGAEAPLLQGRAEIQKHIETMLKDKPAISWTTAHVEVARFGDIAYEWGAGKITLHDKRHKLHTMTFKSLTAWKKQPDGSWKIAVHTSIPDPPAKPPAPRHAKAKPHKQAGRR